MSAGGDGGSGLGPPELPGAQPTAATPPILGQHRNSQTAQDGQPATAQSQTGQTHGTSTGAAKSATKRPARRGGKAVPDRPLRALFCLPLKNPVRKMCIDVIEWKYPFYRTFTFFLSLQEHDLASSWLRSSRYFWLSQVFPILGCISVSGKIRERSRRCVRFLVSIPR